MGKQKKNPNNKKKNKKSSNKPSIINNLRSNNQSIIDEVALNAITGKNNSNNEVGVQNLIKKLSDNDANNRAWAASTISIIFTNDPNSRKGLLSANVVGSLISLLSDPHQEVILEALGTLRNLACMDDPGIPCDMAKKNILEHLHILMEKSAIELNNIVLGIPIKDKEEALRRENSLIIAENIISIIWSMGETNDKLLEQVCKKQDIDYIVSCLNSGEKLPINLTLTAARCLLSLSEFNKSLFQNFFINIPSNLKALDNLLISNFDGKNNNSIHLIKVAICGIITNFRTLITPRIEKMASKSEELSNLILFSDGFFTSSLPVINQALLPAVEISNSIENAIKNECKNGNDINSKPKDTVQDLENKSTLLIHSEQLVTNQHLVLEVLSNIIAEEKGEGFDVEENSIKEAENYDSEYKNELLFKVDGNTNGKFGNEDSTSIRPTVAFIFENLANKLRTLAEPHPWTLNNVNTNGISLNNLPQYQDITASLLRLHSLSLATLANLFAMIDEYADPSQKENINEIYANGLKDIWDFLFQCANSFLNIQDDTTCLKFNRIEAADHALSCLYFMSRWTNLDLLTVNQPHYEFLMKLGSNSNEDMSTEGINLATKSVSVLGFIARKQPNNIQENKVVGDFLFNIINQLKNIDQNQFKLRPDIYLEAINAIFDVYGDMEYDYDLPNFVNGNYLSILEDVFKCLPKLIRVIDRNKFHDLREHAMETVENLRQFIKYKKSEVEEYKAKGLL